MAHSIVTILVSYAKFCSSESISTINQPPSFKDQQNDLMCRRISLSANLSKDFRPMSNPMNYDFM